MRGCISMGSPWWSRISEKARPEPFGEGAAKYSSVNRSGERVRQPLHHRKTVGLVGVDSAQEESRLLPPGLESQQVERTTLARLADDLGHLAGPPLEPSLEASVGGEASHGFLPEARPAPHQSSQHG